MQFEPVFGALSGSLNKLQLLKILEILKVLDFRLSVGIHISRHAHPNLPRAMRRATRLQFPFSAVIVVNQNWFAFLNAGDGVPEDAI